MRSLRARAAVAALVTAGVLLPATVAAAHPGLRPNELRPGETVEAELIIPHGCGTEGGVPEEGEVVSPTVEVAVQWPDGIEIRPVEVDGWATDVADGVATWLDDGGATTDAILVPATVSASTDLQGEIFVSVFQACENGESFRWVATPEEEGSPALRLTVAGEPVPAPTTSPTPVTPSQDPTPTDAPSATPAATPTTPATTPPAATPTPTATPALIATQEPVDDGEVGASFLVMAIGIAVGVGIATVLIRRRRAGASADGGSGPEAGDGGDL